MNGYDLIPRLDRFQSYDHALREFHLQLPAAFNIAEAVCFGHRDAVSKIALFETRVADDNVYTFGALDYLSNKFANVLKRHSIRRGDRIAVMLPQSAAFLIAHLGILKLGGIVIPIAMTASESLINHALKTISPRALITSQEIDVTSRTAIDTSSIESVFIASEFRSREDSGAGYKSFWQEVYRASPDFAIVETDVSTPAFIFHQGAIEDLNPIVHAHRLLIGQLPAFEMANNFDLDGDTIFYTPTDWSDSTVLFGMIYPALVYGCSILAQPSTTQNRLKLSERRKVTNLFLSSDDLEHLLVEKSQHDLNLRNVIAFNSFDQNIEKIFDINLSRLYTTLETGTIAASCHRWFDSVSGSQGREIPGTGIEIIDSAGSILHAGTEGKIAAHKSAPSLFLEYLDQHEKTFAAFNDDWFITSEIGLKDEDKNLRVRR